MNKTAHFNGSTMVFTVIFCFASFLASRANGQTYQYPFQNPTLPLEDRVNNVDSLLTQAEKLSLLPENEPAITRLGLKAFSFFTEGIHGLAWGQGGTYTATQFPQGFGLGETWDPDVMKQAGGVVGRELRVYNNNGKSGLILRAPNADIARDPRWGRTEESYGEDPYLIGKTAAGFIQGLRGNDPKYFMGASMCKHFLANSNEAGRGSSSSNFDQRLLREYYAKSFEIALIEGGGQSYMTAYNAVNGVHCIFNATLKNMVRQDWKWDGAVCSDEGDLGSSSGYTGTAAKVAAAIKNSNMGAFDDQLGTAPADAITSGLMTIGDVDTVIKHSMRVRIRLGEVDPVANVSYKTLTGTPWTSDSSKSIAKLVTQKSIVLLKNANNILPLDKSKVTSIAIIGPRADSVISDFYGGKAPYIVSILSGIKTKLGSGVTVNFARDNTNSAAANYAKTADAAIVCIGNDPLCGAAFGNCPDKSAGKEAVDRQQITVESDQEALVEAVYQANPKTIVVLVSSFPYAITWEKDNIPAILHIANCSQETGSAIADVLFGDYNPAGRLDMTWPDSLSQLPTMLDYNIRNGRTYMYFTGTPLYPFGYGLSYSTFTYANLTTSADNLCQAPITVSVDVTNTSSRPGEEVVQMYLKYPNSAVSRPIKQLRGFKRTAIAAGATATVTMTLPYQDVAYWDSTQASWVAENGSVQILVGGSSADTDLKVSKTISTCSGKVDVYQDKPANSLGRAAFPMNNPMTIVRHGTSIGLSVTLGTAADYDISVFDLRGFRVGRVMGKGTVAGRQFLPLGRSRLAAGLYMVSGRISGKEFSNLSMVR